MSETFWLWFWGIAAAAGFIWIAVDVLDALVHPRPFNWMTFIFIFAFLILYHERKR